MAKFWPLCLAFFALSCFSLAQSRSLSLVDLQDLVDRLGDEFLTHENLNSGSINPIPNIFGGENVPSDEPGLDDEEDLEDFSDIPHPVGLHNWGSHLDIGQVSGVAVDPDDNPVIFQRGNVVWDGKSFNNKFELNDRKVIPNDTIMVLDPDTAEVKESFGGNMFYMPHGLTIDGLGNVWVTDTGLHQVMRFPVGAEKPDLTLGEAFVPGSDLTHFCQPTSVAVSESTGIFFVADGYCNSRIMKFDKDGNLLKVLNGNWQVPHSLSLFEEEDVLCIADREGQRIDCVRAGLTIPKIANRDETGDEVISYTGVGRPFAIDNKGTSILAVSGGPGARGFTIDTAGEQPKVLDQWGIQEGLSAPHDLAISQTGDSVYVAEVDPQKSTKIHKFEVIRTNDFME